MLVNNHSLQNSLVAKNAREYTVIDALSNEARKRVETDDDVSISFDAQLRLKYEVNNILSENQQIAFRQKTSDNIDKIHTFLQQGLTQQTGDIDYPIFMTYQPGSSSLLISAENPDTAFYLNSLIESEEGSIFHQLSKETFEHMKKLGAAQGEQYELSKALITTQQANESLRIRIDG